METTRAQIAHQLMDDLYPDAAWQLRSAPGVTPEIWCAASPPAGDATSYMVRADGQIEIAVVYGDRIGTGTSMSASEAMELAQADAHKLEVSR